MTIRLGEMRVVNDGETITAIEHTLTDTFTTGWIVCTLMCSDCSMVVVKKLDHDRHMVLSTTNGRFYNVSDSQLIENTRLAK